MSTNANKQIKEEKTNDAPRTGYYYEQDSGSPYLFDIKRHKNFGYSAHFHPSIELYFITSGEMSAIMNGKTISVTAGDILFCNPYDVHHYLTSDECFVTVWRAGARFLAEFQSFYKDKVFEHTLRDKEFNKGIFEIILGLPEAPGDIGMLKKIAVTNLILSLLIERYGVRDKPKRSGEIAAKILEYIHANYSQQLTLRQLAREFGYAEMSFSRIFRSSFGVDFRVFLSELRAERADAMLNDEQFIHLNVMQIASACGFDSAATFYRNYKKCYGTTPLKRKNSE
ncbi:MAG: AraC family transcriptional regulator [Firmicutes bacterium]|nr:AraC family transcriptional regulator [Bacillota bacterium]